jgi:geranylgeranyl reductase family protein
LERCDVLVVGAGPAGSTCARRLREAGLDVLILDRASFPRHKPCAGWITPGLFETLGLAPEAYAGGRTLQAFSGFRIGRIGGPARETRYAHAVSFGIRRCEFDQLLLERSGARRRLAAPVARLRRTADGWIADEQVLAGIVIGAGGTFCPVARQLNRPPRRADLVVAQEVEFRLDARQRAACRVAPEIPELYFSPDLRGYGWCLLKGDHLNVGLGRRDRHDFTSHVRAFLAFLARQGRLPADLPSRWLGHAYRLHDGAPGRVIGDGLLLVGDAAGLAAPASGEGIRPAVESGLLAAEAVLAARGRYGREDLEPYRQALDARFGPWRRRLELPRLVAEPLGRLLLGRRWFARHVVLERWFLRRERPLLPIGTAA